MVIRMDDDEYEKKEINKKELIIRLIFAIPILIIYFVFILPAFQHSLTMPLSSSSDVVNIILAIFVLFTAPFAAFALEKEGRPYLALALLLFELILVYIALTAIGG